MNGAVPFLNCELVYWLKNANAGVVHEDVKSPESLRYPLDHAATFFIVADIGNRSIHPALTPNCVKLAKRNV